MYQDWALLGLGILLLVLLERAAVELVEGLVVLPEEVVEGQFLWVVLVVPVIAGHPVAVELLKPLFLI